MTNFVYIAQSMDGYIADKNHSVDWLNGLPEDSNSDMGWSDFMERIDAIVMGRKTIEFLLSYDGDWPYTKPIFALSTTLKSVPEKFKNKFEILAGKPEEIVKTLSNRGYDNLYIDGGQTIQQFLREDLIDEMIITTIPILLGGGVSLFGELETPKKFKHVKVERFADFYVQNTYLVER